MTNLEIDIQIESAQSDIPSAEDLLSWTTAALESHAAEITLRIVDEPESEQLNQTYRKKSGPTNVLSFPFSTQVDTLLHGDLVICAPIVMKEALAQNKPPRAHWAHLTVHGTLHLQGYDHIEVEDAKIMEEREIAILSSLGISNPYE
ncbi:MAG: rRNA maturation RNase YbeY [Gammaproteobacteria bacterium]|nr:rRNA maturation RNase YbeY [Gammaproteobacteria bacterium]